MTDEQNYKTISRCEMEYIDVLKISHCILGDCKGCPDERVVCDEKTKISLMKKIFKLVADKQLVETQLKELLSALYQRTDKPFTLERKDIVELAKDYGIKEEELNGKQ